MMVLSSLFARLALVASSVVLATFAALACSVQAASAAPSLDDRREAARAFREGELAFGRRAFREAAGSFERAAKLVPHPSAWLNASESWERAGEIDRAIADAEAVLEMEKLEPLFAREAKARLARLAPNRGTQRAPEEGTELARAPHQLPDPTAEIRTAEIATATATPASPGLGARMWASGPPLASWIAFGVAGAAVIGGATFGGLTLSAERDFDADPTQAHADTFFARRRGANVSWAIAVGAAAGGALWWILDARERGGPSASVGVVPREEGAMVVGRFVGW